MLILIAVWALIALFLLCCVGSGLIIWAIGAGDDPPPRRCKVPCEPERCRREYRRGE